MQESGILTKIESHDPSAFRDLFDMYHQMVFNLCFRMTGNRQEGEDLTQEVFLKVYQSLNNFRLESKLSTWLYRITINHCLNQQMKKKRQRWLSLEFVMESESDVKNLSLVTTKNNPDIVLEQKETELIVQKCINSLPAKQRIAIILHRYEGLSYQDIADVMKCSVASVESRLFRAKQNLVLKLRPYLKDL